MLIHTLVYFEHPEKQINHNIPFIFIYQQNTTIKIVRKVKSTESSWYKAKKKVCKIFPLSSCRTEASFIKVLTGITVFYKRRDSAEEIHLGL